MSPLNAAICTTISYTLCVEWYYIKNNYLTLRSKVKVPRRHTTLWSCTHIPNIIDLSRDKNVMAWTRKYYLKKQLFDLEVKDQGPTKVITVCDTPPYGHAHTNYLPMKFCWIYLNNWPWGQRSRSHEGHYGTWHTAYGYAPTYQLSLTYLERQKCYGPDKKILWEPARGRGCNFYMCIVMDIKTNTICHVCHMHGFVWGSIAVCTICTKYDINNQYLNVSFCYLSDSNALFFYWVMCSEKIRINWLFHILLR